MNILNTVVLMIWMMLSSCQGVTRDNPASAERPTDPKAYIQPGSKDTATFAGGCFWCTEALFQEISAVDTVLSGYTGGRKAHPTYQQVIRGNTGHAEAIQVIYDPSQLSYDELLEAFFLAHDPTQLNRQGHDVGTQYRSAIFYHNEQQRSKAAYYIKQLNEQEIFSGAVVTALEPLGPFYVAEDYHQNYFKNNPEQAYCQYVIVPKLDTFRRLFLKRY